ncbi:MAG: DUF6677 family protein [Phycisphaerales bacterium]
MGSTSGSGTDEQRINLGAAAAGWVVPGLGQVLLGERRRGFLAMAGVMLLVITGLLVGGLDSVDSDEDRLWFVGQVCAGPVVIGVSYANTALVKSGRFGRLLDAPTRRDMRGAVINSGERISSIKGLAHPNEFGTLLIFLAGLMNLVVILDALVRVPPEPVYARRAGDPTIDSSRGAA